MGKGGFPKSVLFLSSHNVWAPFPDVWRGTIILCLSVGGFGGEAVLVLLFLLRVHYQSLRAVIWSGKVSLHEPWEESSQGAALLLQPPWSHS